MASILFISETYTDINYSIKDGRIMCFYDRGVKKYDESDGTNIDGWINDVVDIVIKSKLNIDSGMGLHAFVYKLIDMGLIDYLKKQ